jgi:hypothetical protein
VLQVFHNIFDIRRLPRCACGGRRAVEVGRATLRVPFATDGCGASRSVTDRVLGVEVPLLWQLAITRMLM